MATKSLNVNGRQVSITIDDPDMPLLYALRDNLALKGPRLIRCASVSPRRSSIVMKVTSGPPDT